MNSDAFNYELYSHQEIDRQHSINKMEKNLLASSKTHTITERFYTPDQFSEEPKRPCPTVSNFAQTHLKGVVIEPEQFSIGSLQSSAQKEIKDISVKIIEEELDESQKRDEAKYLSLCLMAMNLESLIDDAEDDSDPKDSVPIEPYTLTLVSREVCRKTVVPEMNMAVEHIGSMNLDCSGERPTVTMKNGTGCNVFKGFLRPADSYQTKNEMAVIQTSLDKVLKMMSIINNKVGVLEERVRYVENSFSLSQSLKE